MAIEFHCPYCTATIRVPDQHAGKKGTCPKCATKLIVPDIPRHAADPQPPTPSPQAPVPQAPAQAATDETLPQVDTPTVAAAEVPQFAPATTAPSIAKSLRRKRRRSKSRMLFGIGIPLICMLLFFGIMGVIIMNRESPLTGNLTARPLAGFQLPEASVPLTDFGLSADQSSQVLDAFSSDPEAFISDQMQCRILADDSGLRVRLQPGDNFRWFAVDTSRHTPLMIWLRDHRAALNKQRNRLATQAGTDLCKDKLAEAAGESVIYDAIRYRDEFGLNTHCDALGFAVEAVTGQRRSRCVHEDGAATLYFCLPSDTTSFLIQGRKLSDNQIVFPGEFTVTVSDSAATTNDPDPAEQAPGGETSDSPTDTDAQTMEPEDSMTPDTDSNTDPEMKTDSDSPAMSMQQK